MNYIDVYKSRISHLGTNYQEHAYKSGILEFRRYLKYNQHTVRDLKLDKDDSLFDGVILTDKEDENRVSQILLTKVVEDGGLAIQQGDLIWWGEDECPWIIYRSTTSSYQPHQKFYMVRCNYKIKWVDEQGLLQENWAYVLGSKDSKIKDNFRTWHNAITPQPNKYINIIMPHKLMALGTEIMVMDEVWYLVDYDQASVPGIVYMSFTETNLNKQRDSVEEGIANIDKLADWDISMLKNRVVTAGEVFEIGYTVSKNGIAQEVEPAVSVSGHLTLLEDGRIQAGNTGSGVIEVSYNGVTSKQSVTVGKTAAAKMVFIGDEKIRVASKDNKYVLENAVHPNMVKFVLSSEAAGLVTMRTENNICYLTANEKNKLGKFTLKVYYNGSQVVEKNIQVVSLWQVI